MRTVTESPTNNIRQSCVLLSPTSKVIRTLRRITLQANTKPSTAPRTAMPPKEVATLLAALLDVVADGAEEELDPEEPLLLLGVAEAVAVGVAEDGG